MPAVDEISHYGLIQMRRADVHSETHGSKSLAQIGWNHQVTKAQRREQCLAESSDVDHARVPVQSLQRRDRRAFIAVLAVVVILDDPGSGSLRPIEQLQSSRSAHGHTQGKLMRWNDKS